MSRTEDNAAVLKSIAEVLPDGTTNIADVQAYQAAVLIDISRSLAEVADALTEKAEPKGGTTPATAEWLHTKPHRVECSNCGCKVSINAAYNMKYCFECGAKIKEVQA